MILEYSTLSKKLLMENSDEHSILPTKLKSSKHSSLAWFCLPENFFPRLIFKGLEIQAMSIFEREFWSIAKQCYAWKFRKCIGLWAANLRLAWSNKWVDW